MKVLGSTAVALAGVGRLPEWSGCCGSSSSRAVERGRLRRCARSKLCTDREFDEIAAGAGADRGGSGRQGRGRKGLPKFDEADRNGDGQISREEWGGFSGERFAGATESSGGRMSTEDYNAWREQGMQHMEQ